MSSDEWRAKELKPLLNSQSDDTGYWVHQLFYGAKKDVDGEELWFSTSVEGVHADPQHYKDLYEKVYQVRRAELHYLLKRLPKAAQAFGVTLFGTSEGAMTVHRFDDQRYGSMITGRIINAFGCEHCECSLWLLTPGLGGLCAEWLAPCHRRRRRRDGALTASRALGEAAFFIPRLRILLTCSTLSAALSVLH